MSDTCVCLGAENIRSETRGWSFLGVQVERGLIYLQNNHLIYQITAATMDGMLGLLKIRVKRGINLAVRDTMSSDPYVVVTCGNQKLKTRVVKRNCNPEWNEELTLTITDPSIPITLTVYDKDTFTVDDKMGEAQIDLDPYIEAMQMGLEELPNGCAVKKVQPGSTNCLAEESIIEWNNGKMTQHMRLRLKNVECGEVEISLLWVDVPGCRGLKSASAF